MAVRTTRALAREEDAQAEFQQLSGHLREASVSNALQSAAYVPVITILASAGVALVLWAGAAEVFAPLAPPLLRLHRELKRAFDPAGILNPGRMYAEL